MAKRNDPNQSQMLRQVQKMQADMQAAQEALTNEIVEGTAGGGVVKALVNGSGDLQSVTISPDVVDPDDVEMLQDLVVAAVSDGMRKSRDLQASRLGGIAGTLDQAGLGGLFQ